MPAAAADVQLPTEPMSEEDRAAIDADIEAIAAEHPDAIKAQASGD